MNSPKNRLKSSSFCFLLSVALLQFAFGLSAKPAPAKDFKLNPQHYDILHGVKDRIYLCDGLWKLKKLKNTKNNPKNDLGTEKGYWKADFDDKNWPDQVVPWNWNQLYPENWSDKKISRTKSVAFGGVGWYRKHFFVPKKLEGNRLILWFGTVDQDATVYVNGKKVGSHENFARYRLPAKGYDLESFEFDISDTVKFGAENVIAVRVFDDGGGSIHKPGRYSTSDCGGIIQPVYIKIEPAVYAEKIRIKTDLKSSEIKVSCFLKNTTGKTLSIEPTAKVADFKSKRYTPKTNGKATTEKLKKIKLKLGDNKYSFTLKLTDPILWDFENPHLYLLEINGELNGKTALLGAARFGFREFRVKGNKFLLNDKVVRLRGTDVALFNPRRCDIMSNQYDLIDDHIKFETEKLNLNFARCHRWMGRTFHNICDERGLMINESMPLHWPMILTKTWGKLNGCATPPPRAIDTKTLKISQEYIDKALKPWIEESYNHPCVIIYNVANEPYDKPGEKRAPILNKFYDLLKTMDDSRVIAGYSGRWPKRDEAAKTDFYDVHDYTGSHCAAPYPQLLDSLKKFRDDYVDQYKSVKPMINGECIQPHFAVPWYIKNHAKIDLSGKSEISRKEYADFFEKVVDMYNKHKSFVLLEQIISIQRVRLKDAFDWDFGAHKPRELGYKRMIEGHRISDAAEGFNIHAQQLSPYPRKSKNNPDIHGNIIKAIGKACQPLTICCQELEGNVFAGKDLKLKLWAINGTMEKTTSSLELDICLKNKSGETLKKESLQIGELDVGERKLFKRELLIPHHLKTGRYFLELNYHDGDNRLTSNNYDIFVLSEDDCLKEIPSLNTGFFSSIGNFFSGDSSPKVALALENNQAAKKLKTILDSFDVEYGVIKDWSELNNFDILFVAGLGMKTDGDEAKKLEEVRAKIQTWIGKGGKAISISHKSPNPILGMPSSKVKSVAFGGGDFAELVLPKHPLFKEIPQACWDSWNGKYARIYKRVITPLSECTLVRGGFWRLFGMVVAEAKSGKGLVLADQTLAIDKYDTDSVARKYFDNLLNYVFSDEFDGRYAEKMRGKARKALKNETIKVGKTFQVDLRKQANRSFKDKTDGDKKGGWFDQGTKDLRHFPVGKRKFIGIDFEIINPAKNKDKSCVVLGGKYRPYFPVKATIPINKKAKRLFFLVTAAWCGKGTIAEIKVNYKGGTGFAAQRTLPIVSGKNIADWMASVESLPDAKIVWRGINPVSGNEASVYLIEWQNPEPNIEITHIDFISTKTAVPALIAVTGEEF